MHHIMFDIDGTLLQSYDLDSEYFISAVKTVTGIQLNNDWASYTHVTDAGILDEVLTNHNIQNKQIVREKVKHHFLQKLQEGIGSHPIQEIEGASAFLKKLQAIKNIEISLATGGWYESAVLKLDSAGIDIKEMNIASSNDSHIRTKIMKIAASRSKEANISRYTYFGDGIWDKKASEALGFHFILIGNRLQHQPSFANFKAVNQIMDCLKL